MSSPSSSASSSKSQSNASPGRLKRKSRSPDESSEESDDSDAESSGAVDQREDGADPGSDDEDVQVLSHAAQRRLKKKKLVENAVTPSTSKGKQTPKDGEKPKRQNSVWVGNLSFRTTASALKAFFGDAGEVTRVHMPTKAAPGGKPAAGAKAENRGFAYVDFANSDAKVIAITMSEKNLDGRRLLIKDGDDFNGRPKPAGAEAAVVDSTKPAAGHSKTAQKILAAQKQPAGPTLFLGNLGFQATVESITEMLVAHQKRKAKGKALKEDSKDIDEETKDENEPKENVIRKVRMGTFEDSGLCKGFAFVDFTNVEAATAALTNPRNHTLDGRKLVVEYASPDAVRRGGVRVAGAGPRTGKGGKTDKPPRKKPRFETAETAIEAHDGDGTPEEAVAPADSGSANNATKGMSPRKARVDARRTRDERPRPGNRPKPGAALALAKRENVAIVPSTGTRMTFT